LPYYLDKDGIKGYERKIVSEIKHMLNRVHIHFCDRFKSANIPVLP